MINYSKVRQSVQKNPSKKSLSRTNKSHTSSINIKLSQEGPVEPIKMGMKSIFKDKSEVSVGGKGGLLASQQKRHSVKLQSNEKENRAKKRDQHPYDVTIFRPFQETNRYLETERLPKDYKPHHDRTPTKPALRLRTDHSNLKQIRTDHTDHTPDKFRKEPSVRHAAEPTSQLVRVPLEEVKRLMAELLKEKAEVAQLKRELQFYQGHAGQGNANPVLRSLRV